jgi:hypothetical protein
MALVGSVCLAMMKAPAERVQYMRRFGRAHAKATLARTSSDRSAHQRDQGSHKGEGAKRILKRFRRQRTPAADLLRKPNSRSRHSTVTLPHSGWNRARLSYECRPLRDWNHAPGQIQIRAHDVERATTFCRGVLALNCFPFPTLMRPMPGQKAKACTLKTSRT